MSSLEKVIEAEGLELVAHIDAGVGGYEWDEMKVYLKPDNSRFYWLSEGGCSCNYFGMNVYDLGSLEEGTKEDALRAVDSYTRGPYTHVSPDQKNRAVLAIKDVKVSA